MSSSIDESGSKTASTVAPLKRTVQTIKTVVEKVLLESETRALRESGAIDELTAAVHEAMIATRDTAREINETTVELLNKLLLQ